MHILQLFLLQKWQCRVTIRIYRYANQPPRIFKPLCLEASIMDPGSKTSLVDTNTTYQEIYIYMVLTQITFVVSSTDLFCHKPCNIIQILIVYECEGWNISIGERLDCSITRAGRRVKWTIHLSTSGYLFNLHTNIKQLIFLYHSYINSIT